MFFGDRFSAMILEYEMKGGLCVEILRLAEEFSRVLEDDFFDEFGAVVALFHFEGAFGHGERVGVAPVAGGVHPDVFHAVGF